MCTGTLMAHEATMSTTQLTRAACYDVYLPVRQETGTRNQPLRMNWVVVTDENGNRRLHMGWHAGRED